MDAAGPPPFPLVLGIDADADERTIRRAYATRLKALDIEADPAGFQRLRDAFAAALRHVGRAAGSVARQRPDIAEPGPDPTREADAATPPTVLAAAEAIAASLLARLAAKRADWATPRDASIELNELLCDDRLLLIDAWMCFEDGIAQELAGGWTPGNELLLMAASDAFDWTNVRNALAALGQPGAIVTAAIREHGRFVAQMPRITLTQNRVLSRLRKRDFEVTSDLLRQIEALRRMARQFPNWLAVAAPLDAARQLFELERELVPTAQDLAQPMPRAPHDHGPKASWRLVALIFVILPIFFGVLFAVVRSYRADR